eukprot:1138389-Pelagomonas_calceolata.AAC.3
MVSVQCHQSIAGSIAQQKCSATTSVHPNSLSQEEATGQKGPLLRQESCSSHQARKGEHHWL